MSENNGGFGFFKETKQSLLGANTDATLRAGYRPYNFDTKAKRRDVILTDKGWVRRTNHNSVHGGVRQKDEILVREIIDIDTNYMEDESTGPRAKQKNSGESDKEDNSSSNEGDDEEFNPTLAAMESEIKPKVLKTVHTLTKDYNKLIKYQKEKLEDINKWEDANPVNQAWYDGDGGELFE